MGTRHLAPLPQQPQLAVVTLRLLGALALALPHPSHSESQPQRASSHSSGPTVATANIITCDIAVAGGSAASLAAALTAAEAAPELSVCLTDWTDWPGGQMTSGGVPAIDFGGINQQPGT